MIFVKVSFSLHMHIICCVGATVKKVYVYN